MLLRNALHCCLILKIKVTKNNFRALKTYYVGVRKHIMY